MAVTNNWVKEFKHVAMQQLLKYLMSYNMATQALAIDSNAQDIQTTGGAACSINGVNIASLAADAAYDVSAELPYAAWATGQSYTLETEVVDTEGKHWVCIAAHTSDAAKHPLTGADSATYWKRLDKWAVAAVGNVIAQDKQAHYLVCANAAGTLRAFLAYTPGTEGATTTMVIPPYDPERYVAVGYISVVPTSGSHTFGTTALTTVGTFTQIIGWCFPDVTLIDKN